MSETVRAQLIIKTNAPERTTVLPLVGVIPDPAVGAPILLLLTIESYVEVDITEDDPRFLFFNASLGNDQRVLILRNSGTAPLEVQSAVLEDQSIPGAFVEDFTGPVTIPAGTDHEIIIDYTQPGNTNGTATLTITSDLGVELVFLQNLAPD